MLSMIFSQERLTSLLYLAVLVRDTVFLCAHQVYRDFYEKYRGGGWQCALRLFTNSFYRQRSHDRPFFGWYLCTEAGYNLFVSTNVNVYMILMYHDFRWKMLWLWMASCTEAVYSLCTDASTVLQSSSSIFIWDLLCIVHNKMATTKFNYQQYTKNFFLSSHQ